MASAVAFVTTNPLSWHTSTRRYLLLRSNSPYSIRPPLLRQLLQLYSLLLHCLLQLAPLPLVEQEGLLQRAVVRAESKQRVARDLHLLQTCLTHEAQTRVIEDHLQQRSRSLEWSPGDTVVLILATADRVRDSPTSRISNRGL